MFWRVSTYSQQTPADAILDKGHVILEDLLEVEDLAKVCLKPEDITFTMPGNAPT